MSDMGWSAIPSVLQTAQNQLEEAKSIAHHAADKIDTARNTLKTLQGLIDGKKLEPLLVLIQNLENAAHQGLPGQITAMQAAIESVK